MLEKKQDYLKSIDNFGTRPSLVLKILSHTDNILFCWKESPSGSNSVLQ